MTSTDILSEIAQLVKKYEDVSSPVDLLHCISESARMEEANLLLGERLKRDVYSLFGKDDDGVMASNSGRALLEGARVTKLHTAKTCNVYHIDAEVQFRLPASSDSAIGKRKASPSAASAPEELVSVRYQYSEQTVASGSGTHSLQGFREKGVTVIESPYKSINLIVSASRGAAGLDAQNVVDFQLLTAGCSPSDQQVSLQDMMGAGGDDGNGSEGSADSEGSDGGEEEGSGGEGSDGEEGGEGMEEEDSEEGSEEGGDCEQGSEEGSAEGSEGASEGEQAEEGEDGVDTADYFSVQVSVEALAELKQWLGFRALAQQQADEERERAQAKKAKTSKAGKAGARAAALREEEEGGSGDEDEEGADPYERDPALGDLLQFLLSLPYVDEAWGIQDLILNHELGDGDDDGSSDGGSESMFCVPCGTK